jgi:hypothetical protein
MSQITAAQRGVAGWATSPDTLSPIQFLINQFMSSPLQEAVLYAQPRRWPLGPTDTTQANQYKTRSHFKRIRRHAF